MPKPYASTVVKTAISLLPLNIPYALGGESRSRLDCQGLIEICVRENGGSMSYSGSNDMFRNACDWTGTLAEARAQGKLVPGALLFLVSQTGDYPEQYHADGLGNASHVGLYCGDPAAEVVHASSGAGKTVATTLKETKWTHVGLAKAIQYDDLPSGESTPNTQIQYAIVTTESGGLRMWKKPGGNGVINEYMLTIDRNARIPVFRTQRVGTTDWVQTEWSNRNGTHTGWVSMDFLKMADTGTAPEGGVPEYIPETGGMDARIDAMLARWKLDIKELFRSE